MLCRACPVLCLAVVGLATVEAAAQDLVKMTRFGGNATVEIGPVTPNAYLPVFLLPDAVHDPSNLNAALAAGAELARKAL